MDKVSLNIKMLYNDMSKAEKRIADWIFNHPGEIISLSIVELADLCNCSEASVTRFSKKLGLTGYQELKISLAAQRGKSNVNTNITPNDTPLEIYEKICNDVYLSFEKTKKSLNAEFLKLACEKICSASKIIILGLGNSASIATDAGHKFLRAGLNAVSYSDNHMQVIAASHLTKNDVAIAISHSGSSKDIVEAIRLAKEHDATTISITNSGKSPLLKHTDIPLFTSSDETKYSILALNSRITQLAIIDTLYSFVILNHSEKAVQAIKETEHALMSKKY